MPQVSVNAQRQRAHHKGFVGIRRSSEGTRTGHDEIDRDAGGHNAPWPHMTTNEAAIRKTYQVAEDKDIAGFVSCFTEDGTFTDESIGVTYRGPKELGRTVEIYAAAFPDMHRELYAFYVVGDTVVVELALQGTHNGPLHLPIGVIPPTGKRMNAPCCDVFQLTNGKIKSFNCYPSGTVVLTQLGILQKLEAVL
jgi:ketosteroid isomerase-like protein